MGFDADGGDLQRAQHFGGRCLDSRVDLGLGDAHRRLAKSMPSNFLEYSASATSPRALTSSMMARTVTLTSSDISRLVVRNAAKRCSKSPDA
jgi:hypothetical protein